MLTEILIKKLNKQINLEFFSSNLYLQMSSWSEYKGLPGAAAFLKNHAQEEMTHMFKIFDYVNETGGMAEIGKIDSPETNYKSVTDMFEKIYDHECHVTKKINEIVAVAFEKKDFSTFNFLQWFVSEQHEEENLFKTILDKLELIGEEKERLFFFDQMLENMTATGAGVPESV